MSDDKIIELFSEFGKIEKTNSEDLNTSVYLFDCDMKKVMPENVLFRKTGISLNFIVVYKKESDDVTLICFRLSNKELLGEKALELVNRVNGSIEFGRFVLDDDGDMNWIKAFTSSNIFAEDLVDALRSCGNGVTNLVKWIKGEE